MATQRAFRAGATWAVCVGLIGWSSALSAQGVLRVHPDNPRYFTDDSGRAIYLAGHQWFNDLQYNAWNHPVSVDWDRYLAFLQSRDMNYLRNWIIWSVGHPEEARPAPLMPFKRTGPGKALDSRPKFDLTQSDPAFFERMATQVRRAQEKGVYVSIMLFEVYGFMGRGGTYPDNFWAGNVFHGPNNVNGIEADENQDGEGLDFFFTSDPRLLEIQKAYVRKVIDTVNELDNVFFEVANELEAKAWQYDMIRFIKVYEQGKPKQHLVYMSPGGRDRRAKWSPLSRTDLLESPADVVAVMKWEKRYRGDPPVQPPVKPAFMDMDHVAAVDNDGDNDWNNNPTTPWKLLTRGYHQCLYDHDYWKPGANRDRWEQTRFNIGATVSYANGMGLARMNPRPDLSSSRYCLAHPGHEYLLFNPGADKLTVKGLLGEAEYAFEWYHVPVHRVTGRGRFRSTGPIHEFDPPFAEAVFYLKKTQ